MKINRDTSSTNSFEEIKENARKQLTEITNNVSDGESYMIIKSGINGQNEVHILGSVKMLVVSLVGFLRAEDSFFTKEMVDFNRLAEVVGFENAANFVLNAVKKEIEKKCRFENAKTSKDAPTEQKVKLAKLWALATVDINKIVMEESGKENILCLSDTELITLWEKYANPYN